MDIDDWRQVENPDERRRLQNRLNQRKFRQRQKNKATHVRSKDSKNDNLIDSPGLTPPGSVVYAQGRADISQPSSAISNDTFDVYNTQSPGYSEEFHAMELLPFDDFLMPIDENGLVHLPDHQQSPSEVLQQSLGAHYVSLRADIRDNYTTQDKFCEEVVAKLSNGLPFTKAVMHFLA